MLMALCQTDMLSESIVTSPEATEFCVKNIVATNASSTTNSRICPAILNGWGRSQFLTEPLMRPIRSKEDLLFIFFLFFCMTIVGCVLEYSTNVKQTLQKDKQF